MEMMGMMSSFRGGSGRPAFPMVAVPDPRFYFFSPVTDSIECLWLLT